MTKNGGTRSNIGVARAISVSLATAIATLLLISAAGQAQTLVSGSIAGVVRDTTGGVLPGVTVEAASSALIEKVRAVVTDSAGQYKILDLRPGVYVVTFTLGGFSTVRREGIELSTGFTATVNAELNPGTVEQTITVTGANPIIDTQNIRTQNVLSAEVLKAIPTARNVVGYASLMAGAHPSAGPADVGGSQSEQPWISIHDSRAGDYTQMVDGMLYTEYRSTGGGSARVYYPNQMAVEEVVVETSGISAEGETGVNFNAVLKDGSNSFNFDGLANYAGHGLQSGNLTTALRDRGVTATNSVKMIYDAGAGGGGPLMKDELWFYTAHRWWGADQYITGAFANLTPHTPFYTPDPSTQRHTDFGVRSNTLRLTWQATAKQRLTGFIDHQVSCQCLLSTQSAANSSPEATGDVHLAPWLTQATWTYPATSRLLFQAGVTDLRQHWSYDPIAGVLPTDISILNQSTNFIYGSRPPTLTGGAATFASYWSPVVDDGVNLRASSSYITGSHAFKVGLFFQRGGNQTTGRINGDVSYVFSQPTPNAKPVPIAVNQFATPAYQDEEGRDFGIYAQDQWTVRQLTLNLGLRFDSLTTWSPAFTRPGGQFLPALAMPAVSNIPNWKDLDPRLGAAYDVFGNGKTAIKASLGRYVVGDNTTIADAVQPTAALAQVTTRVWNDTNGDYIPQPNELGPSSNAAFGTSVPTIAYAPSVTQGWGVRPYTWQTSAGVQHELHAGVALSLTYFRTAYSNFMVTDNLNVTPAGFSPYCVTAPVNTQLPSGGGNQICGLYDVTPVLFGSVKNQVVPAANFGKQTEVFNGIELYVRARFGRGGLFTGGFSKDTTTTDNCFVVNSPQQLYQCHVDTPSTQIKVSGLYPLLWDFELSGVYQHLTGPAILANLAYSNAQVAPSLGRNLAACGSLASCNATTAPISLIQPGTQFEDPYTQLDLRLAKVIRMGRTRLRAMADAYNVLNASAITARNNTYASTSSPGQWGLPTGTQPGRLFKFGGQIQW